MSAGLMRIFRLPPMRIIDISINHARRQVMAGEGFFEQCKDRPSFGPTSTGIDDFIAGREFRIDDLPQFWTKGVDVLLPPYVRRSI